jgi:hypothetical protein
MTELWGRSWSKDDLLRRVGSVEQLADVTLSEVSDGPGRGVRLLHFRNAGVLAFDVVLDRASDIGRVDAHGRPVAFWSKVGLTPPWRWQDRDDKRGFLGAFAGGLFVTCGLDHISAPEQDPEPSPDGTTTGERYPVHGRVTAMPATLRGHGVRWTGAECELWAETEVRQASMYGENLVLRRRISTPLGHASITVEDRVTNEEFRPSPHMTMYHCNVGFPAIDATSGLTFQPELDAIDGPALPAPLPEPDPTWQTRLQQLAVPEGAFGADVSLSSESGRWNLRWSSQTLPYLMLWQHFEAGSWVLGVQPSTNRADGRTYAREHGELRVLAPGETIAHRLDFTFGAA